MSACSGRKLLRAVLSGSVAAIVAGTGCGMAQAEPAPPFATLLQQSENAPRRAESAAGIARAEGQAEQARARPNPTVGVLSENFAGSAPYRGFGRSETTVQYSQPIELGGKRSARIAAGQAGVVASQARDLDARIGFAYDLARAYAGAEIADELIGIAEDARRHA
jgi:outer membrane protein, heavy metal efflux system